LDEVPKVNCGKVPVFVSSLEFFPSFFYKDLQGGTSQYPMNVGNGDANPKKLKEQGERPLIDGVEKKDNKF
jgi:hypothetical protein